MLPIKVGSFYHYIKVAGVIATVLIILLFIGAQLRQHIEFTIYQDKSSTAVIYLNNNDDDNCHHHYTSKEEYDDFIDDDQALADAGFFVALNETERQTLVDTFRSLVTILNDMKVVWYLDSGSLLGYYRHNSIIPWDDDIDLAMLVDSRVNSSFMREFAWQLKQHANALFGRHHHHHHHHHIVREHFSATTVTLDYVIKFFMTNNDRTLPIDKIPALRWPYVDVLLYLDTASTNVTTTTRKISWKPWSSKQYPLDLVFPLQEIEFEDVKVYAPRKIREYLQISYGENLDDCTPRIWDHRYHKFRRPPTNETRHISCTTLLRKFRNFIGPRNKN